MPIYDYKFLLDTVQNKHASASANSTNEVNFGVVTPKFKDMGLHIVITTAYAGVNSGTNIKVKTGAATAPTTTVVQRLFTAAQLKVLGGHYFIPIPPNSLLQYVRVQYYPVTENTAGGVGRLTSWLGPNTGETI